MKRSSFIAVALAAALALGAGIVPAWAYFTDTTMATGGMPVTVGTTTKMHEYYAVSKKHLTIENDEKSATPVYVRATVLADGPIEDYVDGVTVSGDGWSEDADDNGWYYYSELVDPGKEANELIVAIKFVTIKSEQQPDRSVYEAKEGQQYNVIVYYESTPAIFNSQTNSYDPPDWSKVVASGEEERGN